MHTASLRTPSPNKIANNFGSVSSWIKVKAAIVSVAEITEAKSKSSPVEKCT